MASRPRIRRGYLVAVGVLLVIALLEVGAIVANHIYDGRAWPGTAVAGQDVSGLNEAEIAAKIAGMAAPSSVTVTYGETSVAIDPAAIDLRVDSTESARMALASGRQSSQLGTVFALGGERSEQSVTADRTKLQSLLDAKFAAVLKPATEPAVTFDQDAGEFRLTAGHPGERLDAAAVLSQLSQRWRAGGKITVAAGTIATDPVTSNEAAEQALAEANRMVANDLTLTAGSQSVTVDKSTLASFVKVEKRDGAPIEPVIQAAAIDTYVGRNLRPRIETAKADTVELRKGNRTVLKLPGSPSRVLDDPAKASATIATAMREHATKPIALAVHEQASSTKRVADGEHSVDVDLSKQTLSLQVDGKTVRRYVISSGKPATPTIKGTFHVYYKTKIQDMSGGSGDSAYVLKDVKWNSFFSGNYAFHTANWHNDFGTAVSHGCVNMREADAKSAFDFAPIGTKVTVHD